MHISIKHNLGWEIKLTDKNNLLTGDTIEELKQMNHVIYWNDIDCKHWIFDFKINNVWFEAINIDMNNNKMTLNVFS